jgi:hypothetical protein
MIPILWPGFRREPYAPQLMGELRKGVSVTASNAKAVLEMEERAAEIFLDLACSLIDLCALALLFARQ